MPNRDWTGPNGQGPMTGRWMGNCAGRGQKRFSEEVGREIDYTDESKWGFLGRLGGFFWRGRWRGRWMWPRKGRGRWQGGFGQGAGRWIWRGRS